MAEVPALFAAATALFVQKTTLIPACHAGMGDRWGGDMRELTLFPAQTTLFFPPTVLFPQLQQVDFQRFDHFMHLCAVSGRQTQPKFAPPPAVLHFAAHAPADRKTAMKNKNALTVRPASGLSELKRAESLIRLTQSVLDAPAPARNRTDEQGRKQGYWVLRFADGDVFEGTYVDDREHGHWVERYADGGVWEGSYVDGEKHGHWVERYADGTVWEGPYVNGQEDGHWILRKPDGTEKKENWRNGEIVE